MKPGIKDSSKARSAFTLCPFHWLIDIPCGCSSSEKLINLWTDFISFFTLRYQIWYMYNIYIYIYGVKMQKNGRFFLGGNSIYIYIYGWIRDIYCELTTVTHGHPSVCSACRWETYQIPRRRCDNSKCIPIGSMYAIYGNMDPINIPQMLVYIPYMDPMGIEGFLQ